jgi:RP/EB family microtubule-associated protein
MARVKFNVNSEYAYIQNFKILQSAFPAILPSANMRVSDPALDTFTRHQIDRPVPVESLVKCRMQDNLEFLQWAKKFWDQHYPGGEYDAVGRRKGSGAPPAAAAPRVTTSAMGGRRGGTTPTGTGMRPRVAGGSGSANVAALNQEIAAQKEAIAGLEKERDFYFAKLRDIELLLQNAVEADPELEKDDDSLVKHIQAILYSTEV